MTAFDVVQEWAGVQGPRHDLYIQHPGLVLRWLNQSQLRFVDKSECLKSTWTPSLDSSGYKSLPDDFLRIAGPLGVQWDTDEFLTKEDYAKLNGLTLTDTEHYAIHDGKFYVFAATSGTPVIVYIKKPEELLLTNYLNSDLDIPEEYHQDLIVYMDAMYARHMGDVAQYLILLDKGDMKAKEAGLQVDYRTGPLPRTIARQF